MNKTWGILQGLMLFLWLVCHCTLFSCIPTDCMPWCVYLKSSLISLHTYCESHARAHYLILEDDRMTILSNLCLHCLTLGFVLSILIGNLSSKANLITVPYNWKECQTFCQISAAVQTAPKLKGGNYSRNDKSSARIDLGLDWLAERKGLCQWTI